MTKKQLIFDMFLLAILSGVLFLLFSGSYPFLIPDEARYIEVAREMVVSGNYITPHLNGSIFLDKPILFYWCESALIHLFGLHEWSMRLLPEFFGVLGCIFSYWAGIKLYNRRTGVLSALILMSTVLYFGASHYVNMDLMVAVLISCALWLFIVAMNDLQGRIRTQQLLLAYVFAGLAFLAKGLIGFVFPIAIIGLWVVIMNQWSIFKKMHLIAGLMIMAVIVLPWLILVQRQTPVFSHYFFYIQQFSRYLTNHFNQHQPFFFYGIVILIGMLPWSLFLFQAIYFFVTRMIKNKRNCSSEVFIGIWALFIFLFFSIPQSKMVGYILSVFPPLSMMLARYLDLHWSQVIKTKKYGIANMICLLFFITMSSALIYIGHRHLWVSYDGIIYLYILAGLFLLFAVVNIMLTFYGRSFKIYFVALFFGSVIVEVTMVASVWTYPLYNIKSLALEMRHKTKPQDIVGSFGSYYYDLPVYLNQDIYALSDWDRHPSIKKGWAITWGDGLLYQYQQPSYFITTENVTVLWHGPHRLFLLVNLADEEKLKKLVQSPIYQLDHVDSVELVSNRSK